MQTDSNGTTPDGDINMGKTFLPPSFLLLALWMDILYLICLFVATGEMFGTISTLKTLPAEDDISPTVLTNGMIKQEEEEDIYVDEDEPLEDDDEDDDEHQSDRRRYM